MAEPIGKQPPRRREPTDPDLEETGYIEDPSEDTEEDSDLDVIDGSELEFLVPEEKVEEETRDSMDESEKPPIVLGADEQMEVAPHKRTTWDDEEEMTQFGDDDALYIGKGFAQELKTNEQLDVVDKKLITRVVVTLGAYVDKAMDEVFHINSFAGGETLANITMDVRRADRIQKVSIFLHRNVENLSKDFADIIELEMNNIEANSGMKISPKQKIYEVTLIFDKIREQLETDVLNKYLTGEDKKFITNLEFSLDKALSRAQEKLAKSFRE
ncbi:hypothetical protein KKC88_06190 [Patescibacteria group bacterium]|nr:hypothetical protein [Patescibacteria group bacterium]MBU1673928.1 hypothetical protein [Patescibacteria group bacterium]MBU1963922.1 hypothetical protein [Patescibacteria group bacterium]